MKKFLFVSAFFVLGMAIVSCSSDDDKDTANGVSPNELMTNIEVQNSQITSVEFQGMQVPYEPVKLEELPEWLQDWTSAWRLNTRDAVQGTGEVFKGTLEDRIVYWYYSGFWSIVIGQMGYEDGERIPIDDYTLYMETIQSVKDWKCIFLGEVFLYSLSENK